MARVLITGSTTGLGLDAARQLIDEGHDVVLHARNDERAATIGHLADRAVGIVVGDLSGLDETRRLAEQVRAVGGVDAVIHNAGVYVDRARVATVDGHARTLAVNVLAPYVLTTWIEGVARLVYVSSDMHRSGDPSLQDIDWTARPWNGIQAYCDSKLFVTALALATGRRRPDCCVNAVDPGWVPTRMGGPGAPDDLDLGHRTQTWLAVSDDHDATTTGGYWYHGHRRTPAPTAADGDFQDALLDALTRLTGVRPA